VLSAEPRIDVAIETSGDAFIVDATMDIQVPLEVAWDVYVDIDHATTFLHNIHLSKIISRSGNSLVVRQEGIARYGLLSYSFATEREIQLDPMRRIVTRQLTGTMKKMQSEAQFSVADPGVRIRYHAEIVPDSVLARLFGQSFVKHEVIEQLTLMTKEMMRRHDQRCPSPCRQ
jgi:hypothetical protein